MTKKLKDLYMRDPAAKKFLEEHPEFDDRFLEQSEQHSPGFDTKKGRFTLHDVGTDRKQFGELMLSAVSLLPEDSQYKQLLEWYYEGVSLKELQKRFKIKSLNALWGRLCRAKKAALKNMVTRQNVKIKGATPQAVRTFTYQGEVRFVYLVFDEFTQDHVWTKESGEILPEAIQEILDSDPEFKEWDEMWLG